MSNGKKKTDEPKKVGGPYLAAAFFCENVIEDKQGSLSALRIIDRFDIQLGADTPAGLPSEEGTLPITVCAVFSFKTGDSPGEHDLRLEFTSPSGKKNAPHETKLKLSEHPFGGANMVLRQTIAVAKAGLFWIDVFLDDKLLTRMPLMITIRRAEPEPQQALPAPPVTTEPKPKKKKR